MKNQKRYKLYFVLVFFPLLGLIAQCGSKRNADKHSEITAVDSLKIWVYHWGENPNEMPDSAIVYIDKLLLISETENKYADMITAYKTRQFYYQLRGDFSEAYRSALQRADVAKLSGDSLKIKETIHDIGRFLFNHGRHHESLAYFLQLENVGQSSDSRALLFYILGQVYSMTKSGDNYEELITRYYDLAEKETQKSDFTDFTIKTKILFGRANLLIRYLPSDLYGFEPLAPSRIDSLNTAISLLEEALEIIENPIYNAAIALSYAQLGQFAQARQYEQKAFDAILTDVTSKANNLQDFRQVNYVRSIIRYREKKFDEAIQYASSNVEDYLAIDDLSDAYLNMSVIYNAYKATNETEKALHFLEQMKEIHDKKIKKEKQEQVIFNQIKYDSQVKDEEIREMNRRNKEIYFRSVIFGAVGFIFIIMSIVLYRLYSKKQKAYHELVRKSQEWAAVATKKNKQDALELENQEEDDPVQEDNKTENISKQTTQADTPDETDWLIMNNILQLMTEEKLYTNVDLTIDLLAKKVGTKRHYVSAVINLCTQKNFNIFVNEYRIKEAIHLLSGNDVNIFSVDKIAYDSGFNDRKSFYRVFKKMTGLSPTEFRKNL